jgi:hypothetical protein
MATYATPHLAQCRKGWDRPGGIRSPSSVEERRDDVSCRDQEWHDEIRRFARFREHSLVKDHPPHRPALVELLLITRARYDLLARIVLVNLPGRFLAGVLPIYT